MVNGSSSRSPARQSRSEPGPAELRPEPVCRHREPRRRPAGHDRSRAKSRVAPPGSGRLRIPRCTSFVARVVDGDVGHVLEPCDVGRGDAADDVDLLAASASIKASAVGYLRKTICFTAGPFTRVNRVELGGVGGGGNDVPHAVGDTELCDVGTDVGGARVHVRGHDVQQEIRRRTRAAGYVISTVRSSIARPLQPDERIACVRPVLVAGVFERVHDVGGGDGLAVGPRKTLAHRVDPAAVRSVGTHADATPGADGASSDRCR